MSSRKTNMVSIIITTKNRKKDVLECLASVKQIDYPNYETIVVDDGSTDGSVEALKKERDGFKLIETGGAVGSAAAINIGIRHSKGEFFFHLDDDVVTQKDTVAELVRVMESDDRIGIAGSLTYFYGEPDEIWFYPREFSIEKEKHCYTDVMTAVGCAFMIRKAVIDKIGLYDEDYFFLHEEADLCMRARKQGFRVVCALRSSVYHKIPVKDPGREFSPRVYYWNRNFFLFAKKNYVRSRDRLNFLFQSFIFYPHFARGKPILCHFPWINPIKALMTLKIDYLVAYFKGVIAGVTWFLNH